MSEPSRRFPPHWHADPMPGGYVVRDANGHALGYLYCRDNDAEARQARKAPSQKRSIRAATRDQSPFLQRLGSRCSCLAAPRNAHRLTQALHTKHLQLHGCSVRHEHGSKLAVPPA
jgi:hypothetical protein